MFRLTYTTVVTDAAETDASTKVILVGVIAISIYPRRGDNYQYLSPSF